jgi:hypothetical protein
MGVPHQVFEKARKCGGPAADGGLRSLVDFTHDASPGDYDAAVQMAPFVIRADHQRAVRSQSAFRSALILSAVDLNPWVILV